MPGFGYGSWGDSPFGEWWWSRYVLYDLIPSLYREADTSGFLEKYADALRPSFDELRRKIRDFGELRDPLLVRSAVSEQHTVRLGKKVVLRGGIEQSGVDGKVAVYGEFTAASGRFTERDLGKELSLRRSSIAANNRSVTITGVVNHSTVVVSPRLDIDAGPVRWEVREIFKDPPNQSTVEIRGGGAELGKVARGWLLDDGFTSFPVTDRKVFIVPTSERALLTEREGTDGTIDPSGRLASSQYAFNYGDVGKVVLLTGSTYADNNGRFEILGVDRLSPTDGRAVFSRLDVPGRSGALVDVNGTVRYRNLPLKAARVHHKQAGLATALSVSVDGDDITVNLATDGAGNVTSTAAAVVAAIAADGAASLLVEATVPGTGSGLVGATDALQFIPGVSPQVDQKLVWAMMPFGRLVVTGPTPAGLVVADGSDGLVEPLTATQGRLRVLSTAPFTTGDIGRLVVIRGSQVGNDGTYEVVDVPAVGGGTFAVLNGVFVAESGSNPVFWELRTRSGHDGALDAVASAPSMLAHLAKDFGIEVDTQDSEDRQRSWVRFVNEWVDKKGLARAYEILATISGFRAEVSQLFRVSAAMAGGLPADHVFEITDRAGVDASVSPVLGDTVRIEAPTGAFEPADLGRFVRVQGAALPSNNQLYEVQTWESATAVTARALEISPPLPPDPSNGALRWSVLRLYTDLLPARPNFDEFDSDAMAVLIPGLTVDSLCGEVEIALGTGAASGVLAIRGVYVVSFESQVLWLDGDISIVKALGLWKLTDANGQEAFIEAVPEPVANVTVGSGNASVAYFQYDPANPSLIAVAHKNLGAGVANPTTTVTVVSGAYQYVQVLLRSDVMGNVLATASEVRTALLNTPATAGLVGVSFYPGNGTGTAVATPGSSSGAITSGLSTFVDATTNPFTAADVGAVLFVSGAGADTGYYRVASLGGVSTVTVQNMDGSAKTWAATMSGLTYTVFRPLTQNGIYRTEVAAGIARVTGAARLDYECELNLRPDYCASYRVLLSLESDAVTEESGLALERAFERMLKRLGDVTPAHVELVPRFIQPITASLNLTATIEPVEVAAELFAPLSFYFDDVPPDDPLYEIDSGPYVTITTP